MGRSGLRGCTPSPGRAFLYVHHAGAPLTSADFETMTPTTILWIYIVLLVAGGLMGFVKAGSKMSLLTSLAFAAVLSLCNAKVIQVKYLVDITLAVLIVFFGMRFAKTKKFMPMGMMAILTVVTLAALHLVH